MPYAKQPPCHKIRPRRVAPVALANPGAAQPRASLVAPHRCTGRCWYGYGTHKKTCRAHKGFCGQRDTADVEATRTDAFARPHEPGFDLRELLAEVARPHIERPLQETEHNRARASKKLGLPGYQTLGNWMKKYGVQ